MAQQLTGTKKVLSVMILATALAGCSNSGRRRQQMAMPHQRQAQQ